LAGLTSSLEDLEEVKLEDNAFSIDSIYILAKSFLSILDFLGVFSPLKLLTIPPILLTKSLPAVTRVAAVSIVVLTPFTNPFPKSSIKFVDSSL